MVNKIIHTENINQLKCLYWQRQPVYYQYAKLKNFIRQHFDEEVAAVFAEPHIADENSDTKTIWTSDSFDETAVPLTLLSDELRIAIEKKILTKLSLIQNFYQQLLESEKPDDNKWGQLLSKAIEIPDKKYILVQNDRFVLVFWGFEMPGDEVHKYSIKRDFIPVKISFEDYKEAKQEKADEVVREEINRDPSEHLTGIEEDTNGNHAQSQSQTRGGGADNPEDTNDKNGQKAEPRFRSRTNKPIGPVLKRRKWWILLLLFLLIFLLIYFWRHNGAGLLPAHPGKIVPIDSLRIIKDPENIKSIVSDRLNIALTGKNKDIQMFAEKFKNLYRDSEYQIIYYDTISHRIQIQIPVESREALKMELKSKLPEFEMLIWYESIMEHNRQPNDPAFLNNNEDWYQRDVKALEAWDITQGNNDLIIAVIDDGFDLRHPEFQGKIYKPWNIPAGNSLVNTGRNSFHGTHVAGIALAQSDNNMGTSGIAPNCKFMPVQVGDFNGIMSSTAIIDGILYAVDNGADIINMSLGMQASNDVSRLPVEMQQALINSTFKEEEAFWDQLFEIAYKKNIVIVLAAGNQNIVIGLDPMERSNKTIKVSAVNMENEKAEFSNYGSASTISAPGVHIFSSVPNNHYAYLDGTSMAAPIVTGGVALIKSVNPSLTFDQIVDLMQATGIPVNSQQYIGNILQLDRALDIATRDRKQMPVVACPNVQDKIDSLLQEIEKLRQDCSGGTVTKDTLKIPHQSNDLNFAIGRWKSTSYIYSLRTGQKVTLYFDFYKDGTGEITLIQSDNTQCSAPLSLTIVNDLFNITQTMSAACQPPPQEYQPYIFNCKPGFNGCAECEAQNRQRAKNNFKFNLVKIN